jgi:hypothetical protein
MVNDLARNLQRPSVFIVLLNYNGVHDTLECVESLQKITYPNYQIIVVDNGSSGDDVEQLHSLGNRIQLIESDINRGFSGGNNLGITYALNSGAAYIMLLNNDTIVEPDFIDRLIEGFGDDDKIGITVPKINYYAERGKIWYGGGDISKYRASGFTDGVGEDESKHNVDKYVTFATGCCLLIRADSIAKVGFMDENYFLYLEDTDYCMRFINAGYRIKYVGGGKIYHKVSAATQKHNSLLPVYYVTRNRLYFAKKFFEREFFLISAFIHVLFVPKRIYWAITRKSEYKKIVTKAFRDFRDNKMGKAGL